jgi:hypothetical protein
MFTHPAVRFGLGPVLMKKVGLLESECMSEPGIGCEMQIHEDEAVLAVGGPDSKERNHPGQKKP